MAVNIWDHVNPADPNAYYVRDYAEDVDEFIADALKSPATKRCRLYTAALLVVGAAVVAWKAVPR